MEYRKVNAMSRDEKSSPDDRRSMLADYLGGELDPRKRADFEQEMQDNPELTMEVASLQGALRDLRSLDDGEVTARAAQSPEQTVTTMRRGAYALRYAAMIGLAFFIGYVMRGMEAQPTPLPPPVGSSEAGTQVEGRLDAQEDFGTRFARNFLDQPGRSGFGRSPIAYSRTARQTNKKN